MHENERAGQIDLNTCKATAQTMFVTMFVVVLLLAGVPAATAAAPTAVPAAIHAIAERGEDAYDAGRAGNWVKASREATAIDAAVAGSEAARNADMQTAVLALRRAITDRDRDGAVNAANHITFLAAQLSAPYHPQIPVEVALLDYYGRDMEIALDSSDLARLGRTASDAKRTWLAVRPRVLPRAGGQAAAHGMDLIIEQLTDASGPTVYRKPAAALLEQVDVLETVFTTGR